MRVVSLLLAATTLGATDAFVSQGPASRVASTSLRAATSSGLSHDVVRKTIKQVTKENFDESLKVVEPFLLNDAGRTFYSKSLSRLAFQAKELGVAMPADYAKEAKCTEKRRTKQNEFIQTKEEERLATEAEAAEAAAAEEPEAEEEPVAEEAAVAVEEAEPVAA